MSWKLLTTVILASLFAVPLLITAIRTLIEGSAPAWVPGDIAAAEARAAAEGWLHRSLAAFDIAFNVIVLRGQQDETISTHAYRAAVAGRFWGKLMCRWLDWFQPNHGPKAASGDLERATARVAVLNRLLGVGTGGQAK